MLEQPLKALEAYQLSFGLARRLDDAKGCASSLCHSARLLLDLGAPELAEVIQFPQLLCRMNLGYNCLKGNYNVLITLLSQIGKGTAFTHVICVPFLFNIISYFCLCRIP